MNNNITFYIGCLITFCMPLLRIDGMHYQSFIPALFNDANIRQTIKLYDFDQSVATGGSMYTVSESGIYHVADDLIVTPANPDIAIITIAASNVTLFIDNHVITQYPATNNRVTAIAVAPGVANVVILNGIISDIQGTGIAINASAMNITLANMLIDQCTLLGIAINNASQIRIENSSVTRCNGSDPSATDGAVGIKINHSTQVVCKQVNSNAHTSADTSSTGILLVNSNECQFIQTITTGNQGSAGYGFALTATSTSCYFNQCVASNNTARTSTAAGFLCSYSNGNEFKDCRAHSNQAHTGICAGWLLEHTNATLIQQSSARNNNSTTHRCYGLYTRDGSANSFVDCTIIGNSAPDKAVGIGLLLHEKSTSIRHCTIAANNATNEAYGIMLGQKEDPVMPEYCYIDNNMINNNIGGNKQYGIRDFSIPTASCYTQNIAYGHGPIKPSFKELTDTGAMNFMINLSPNSQSNRLFQEVSSQENGKLERKSDLTNLSIY